jgi:hypothetical protein
VFVSGALATIHLWRALFLRHPELWQAPPPEPAGADRPPPRHRVPHLAADDSHDSGRDGRAQS